MTIPASEQGLFENPIFWCPERYTGLQTARAEYAKGWIPPTTESVLDIGCGNGVFTNRLLHIPVVVGVDRSRSALRHVQVPRCQGDIAHLPFSCGSFDLVATMEVIEHLPFHIFRDSLRELARVARRYVFITVPHQENLALSRVVCPKCACEFHRDWHMRSFNKPDLERLFLDQHLSLSLVRLERVFPRRVPYPTDQIRTVLRIRSAFPWFAVCPQCGYRSENADPSADDVSTDTEDQQGTNPFKLLIKRFWPVRTTKYRWWMALYARG
jgi:SAM-dependent methyltransferase